MDARPRFTTLSGGISLNAILYVCLSLALMLATIALVHQLRLRRALERLLRRLLEHWRREDHE